MKPGIMTSNQIKFLISILLILLFIGDILTRIFYCSSINLDFNSQEFYNISSPIISFLGFIAVIITILLTLNQIKHQQGENYVNYYRDFINKILNEKVGVYSTTELLDFTIFLSNKYDELKKYPEYFNDLIKFKNGNKIFIKNKSYDVVLNDVRWFTTGLILLLKKYKNLIREISNHKNLTKAQKNILIQTLFDSQVEKYYYSCQIVETDQDFSELKNKFYWGFEFVNNDTLLVFNPEFYSLKKMIENNLELKKLMESQT